MRGNLLLERSLVTLYEENKFSSSWFDNKNFILNSGVVMKLTLFNFLFLRGWIISANIWVQ